MIALPKYHEHDLVIASVSGGKDSAALLIALQEAGIPFTAVFADTGWEAPETYAHLETMERVLGITIHRVGFPGGMRAKVLARAGFPARLQRWCTVELKVKPLDAFSLDLGEREQRAVLQAVGIRSEESEKRAAMAEVERDDSRDLTVQLLAYLTRAHAAATLLAQATAIVDWSEVAGWCVRAANHYSAPDAVRLLGASTQVAFAEDDRATLIRECVDSLARAHAIRPLHEIDGALEAAEYAQGAQR